MKGFLQMPEFLIAAETEEMMDWIREIVSYGIRRPGWPADLKTEDFIEAKFKRFGLDSIEKEPVPVNRWIPSNTSLAVAGKDTECIAVPYTAWTGDSGIEAPLVYIGEGTAEQLEGKDLAGKIAVLDARFADLSAGMLRAGELASYDPDGNIPEGVIHTANWLIRNFTAYYEAQMRGALGFVGLLVDSPIDGCSYWVPYDGFMKELPAVWVGRELAEGVREAAKSGAVAKLVSAGETTTFDTHNIIGKIKGKGDESILLTSHHDAPFASAVEDASGIALLLALAKTFAQREVELDRTLIFIGASGHFHGGIGNRKYVEKHKGAGLEKAVASFGMEHIANEVEEDGQGGYRLTGLPEVRALFAQGDPLVALIAKGIEKWGMDRSLVVDPYLFGPEPPCDSAPFFTAGIPSLNLISGPLYLFDAYDTPDKVREQDLVPVASFLAELIQEVDKLPIADLEKGLKHGRNDPPAPPAHWFLPPEAYLASREK
jgi:hypothetical protein